MFDFDQHELQTEYIHWFRIGFDSDFDNSAYIHKQWR